jgi:hypothetical protein
MVEIRSDADWGRASLNAGPVALPASVHFTVTADVFSVVTGDPGLVRQGFAGQYGFFFELGIRAEAGHAFAGTDLTNTLWMSLNVGRSDVFALLRAVDAPQSLALDARGPAPGLKVFRARPQAGAAEFDKGKKIEVVFNLLPDGWECRSITSPLRHTPGQYKALFQPQKGTWKDLGLTEAPTRVWVWAHAGNWSTGRGEGEVAARVDAPCE